jgi:peptide/nickel transport system substrate-binding protein
VPRERDGREFRFTALTAPPGDAAIYMQSALRGIGVQMEVQPINGSILKKRLLAKDFEACFCNPPGVWGNPLAMFRESSSVGYRNPQLTRLLDAADGTADPDELEQACRSISQILREDQPVAFLTRPAKAYVVHHRVKGLTGPWHANPLMFTEDLSLDGGRH